MLFVPVPVVVTDDLHVTMPRDDSHGGTLAVRKTATLAVGGGDRPEHGNIRPIVALSDPNEIGDQHNMGHAVVTPTDDVPAQDGMGGHRERTVTVGLAG